MFLDLFGGVFRTLSNIYNEDDTFLTKTALSKKCVHSELFWSAFSRLWTEYGEILRISQYSVRMWENTNQNNSKYGHFLRSVVNDQNS